MKKVGFFGGCFNPPSIVHVELANNLINKKNLDKVIFVPVGDFYEKKDLVQAKHRYNMLKLAIKGYENLEIDDIELQEKSKLYAVDIFKLINEKYKNEDIYYIMGSDNFNKMNTWKDYERIKNYQYLVLERNQDDCISSTKIRNMIRNKIDTSKYIRKEVYDYINQNNLYI